MAPDHLTAIMASAPRSLAARFRHSPAGIGFAQQVRIHDPAILLARAQAHPLDFVVGSEIGAPKNIEVRFGQTRKRLRAVEQYDHTAEFARETARELASGGQQHAFADLIERDAMFRRQHLHAADPGDHLDVQREPLGAHALDDPQRAVVDRRIAPHQNASDFVFLKLALEAVTIDIGEATMPFVDAGEIVAGARALRDVDVDGAVIRMFDEALADRGAQIAQGGLLGPLVGNEEHIDLVERLDRLDGHVIGISDADADDEYLAHLCLYRAHYFSRTPQPATISQASEARAAVRWPSRPARSRNRRNPWSIGTGPQPISSPTTMTGCGAARKPSSWRSHAATRLASSRSRRSASHSPMLSITAPEGAGRRSASACTMSAGASSVRHAAGRSARWRRTRSTISSSRASVL